MGIAIVAATFMIVDRLSTFLIFMLLLETAILGVFVSTNLFLFSCSGKRCSSLCTSSWGSGEKRGGSTPP
jgi:hypothetical protein